ncbi:MAG TPA: glutathione S-transferase family protein [Kofleriaceae bacterium]|nr:glutathione S-transferase family protein [Kofleriaceae bacterium]HMG56857.1 glutathione S-transferase family protein [Kofleriaceae bacterium]
MAITLYYAPHTRAARVAFLLEELGVGYDRRTLDLAAGDNKQPAYLAVHPHGLVPALRDGDTVVFETAAICLYLADRFPAQGLAPPPGSPERAAYYQWVVYAVATLEPALADIWLQRQRPEAERDPAVLAAAHQRFGEAAGVLGAALAAPYLVGGRFTAADVLIGSMLVWARSMELLDGHPRIADYAARIAARPAFGRS